MESEVAKISEALNTIKVTLVCIAVSIWGLTVYFLLKELPIWWRSFNKDDNDGSL